MDDLIHPTKPFRSKTFSIVLIIFWTLVIGLSLIWNLTVQQKEIYESAQIEARTSIVKDITYRYWNASYGGVYAEITETSQPNPHLLNIPDRDIITPLGKELTLINPAYMTRQVHKISQEKFNLHGHITSLNPIRSENKPDEWEYIALQEFEKGAKEYSSVESINDLPYMRLMIPLETQDQCLKCHAVQGYKIGDVRGGISVSTPLIPLEKVAKSNIIAISTGHITLWILGLLGIFLSISNLKRRFHERDNAVADYKNEKELSENLYVELQESYTDISRLNKKITDELKDAHDVQVSLLPEYSPEMKGYEITGYCKPAREVGGDFYDFVEPDQDQLLIMLGDVAGKGMPAAIVMAETRSVLRTHALLKPALDLGVIMNRANLMRCEDLSGLFVTCFMGVLNPEDGEFSYCNAGHNPPFLFRKASNKADLLHNTGIVLGALQSTHFKQKITFMEPGDILVIYSDGITEAENSAYEQFEEERLLEVIRKNSNCTAKEIHQAVLDAITDFIGDMEQSDDITLVIVRRQPAEFSKI